MPIGITTKQTFVSSSITEAILSYHAIQRPASRRPNGLSLSCTARAHVPKPTRHGGCRRGVAEPRLAICNRRVATHSCMLTRQLGCRASAGPCRLLARVSRWGAVRHSWTTLGSAHRTYFHWTHLGEPASRNRNSL